LGAGSERELKSLQRLTFKLISTPLVGDFKTQITRAQADTFIKPNDRLTSVDRLELYNQQYWLRLIDILYEDFPGVLAAVGKRRFDKLVREYLAEHPSRSWTLRNLGSRLPEFIEKHPSLVGSKFKLAHDMARFEWAQVVAFDGPAEPPVTIDALLGRDPAKLKLGVQPYITLLELDYPLDDFDLAMKQSGSERKKKPRLPRRAKTFLAVHRMDNELYYKRLEPAAFMLLVELRHGRTLGKACATAARNGADATSIQEWFQRWAGMGWFCQAK
jgi:hypothetical protein